MINTLIIDDETHCINRLSSLLYGEFDKQILLSGTFQSVSAGIEGIKKLKPALVFLDVQLQDGSGFDLLKHLASINFEIIFTTAYEKYAVQAFKVSAIDYLLKPIELQDLRNAITKVNDKISKEEVAMKLDVLFHHLQGKKDTSGKISIPTLNGLVFVQIDQIVRCQSDVNYTHVYLKDKQRLVVAKTLKDFEELLSPYNFYRIHNSHLINMACIGSYHKGKGGYITLNDQTELEISTRRKEEFLKLVLLQNPLKHTRF